MMYMDHYVLCAAFVYLTNTQHTFHTFDRTTHTRSKNIMHYKYRGTLSGAVKQNNRGSFSHYTITQLFREAVFGSWLSRTQEVPRWRINMADTPRGIVDPQGHNITVMSFGRAGSASPLPVESRHTPATKGAPRDVSQKADVASSLTRGGRVSAPH